MCMKNRPSRRRRGRSATARRSGRKNNGPRETRIGRPEGRFAQSDTRLSNGIGTTDNKRT